MKNMRLFIMLAFLFYFAKPQAQPAFNYTIQVEPTSISGLDGLHSYAFGQHDDKWIFIGGRWDGIHARQPFNAFPENQNNTTIYIVDPNTEEVWTKSILELPVGLKEQLQSTNMQFYQDGSRLYFLGGYGYSAVEGDHMTYPYLTSVDLPSLLNAIVAGDDIGNSFDQITDDKFAICGGNLGKIGEEFYLIGGHRFDGRYNPMNHPTFVQEYSNQIRKFKISNTGGLSIYDYSAVTDEVNLHRRDYNLVPQIYPDGTFGYTIFSGVFQINQDLPFLYPVDITADGHTPISDFNQLLCNYHSAKVALYENSSNVMHTLFFGGISQYYYANGTLVQDDDVPFVKTISRVSRAADGTLTEVAESVSMPAYVGASAEFIINESLSLIENEIINLDELSEDTILIGHIFGGIESPALNPFTFNNTEVTSASNTIFKISLVKEESTTNTIALEGYHDFNIQVFPNSTDSQVFTVTMDIPEPGDIEILLTNAEGKIIYNEEVEGFDKNENKIKVELLDQASGIYFLTIALNGKYFATEKIIVL